MNDEELLMEEENVEVTEKAEDAEEQSGGIGVGLAMLIGSGLTVGAIAIGKRLRKKWQNRKSKKDGVINVPVDDVREVDDNQENDENEED